MVATVRSQNTTAAANSDSGDKIGEACSRSPSFSFAANQVDNIRQVQVWHVPDSSVFFFEDGMTIDADGAPNAYNPDNTGLDDLANADTQDIGEPSLTDHDGNPYIQGSDDPFPGYYVSTTR